MSDQLQIQRITLLEKQLPTQHTLFSIVGSDGKTHLRVFEPYTWAWVGEKIAGGIISGVAGRIITDLLFGDDFANQLKIFLREFERLLRQALQEERLQVIESRARSLTRLWSEYGNSPSPLRLENILMVSSDLVTESFQLGLGGVPAYALCSSIRLGALQQQYHVSGFAEGDATNLKQAADHYLKDARINAQRLTSWNANRFGPVEAEYEYVGRRNAENLPERPHKGPLKRYVCTLDGQTIHVCDAGNSPGDAENARSVIIGRERDRQDKLILDDLWVLCGYWEKIAAGEFPKSQSEIE